MLATGVGATGLGDFRSVTRFLFVRHAQSQWNAQGRWQGWADPDLSDEGIDATKAVAPSFGDHVFSGAIASDLRRAGHTLELLVPSLDGPPPQRVDARLRERDVGAWSGLTSEEIEAGWPGQIQAWARGALASPPGGETTDAIVERATASLRDLAAAEPEGCLLVVSHGGVIRTLERTLGLTASPVANLHGRWFHLDGQTLSAGSSFDPCRPPCDPAPVPVRP